MVVLAVVVVGTVAQVELVHKEIVVELLLETVAVVVVVKVLLALEGLEVVDKTIQLLMEHRLESAV